jgi:hypothetical protein
VGRKLQTYEGVGGMFDRVRRHARRIVHDIDVEFYLLTCWADTTLDAVEDALKELEAARATIGGAAIVQVDVERHAQYGFGGIDSYIGKYSDYYIN